ncbi:DUF3857 domain-containing transglutaminase family protein [Chitinimonas sp. BJB300]|uniref:DUF3857 domain-containing transglutaminase family protein n=1 Tax=Chitinimonas sp. BJB300 TaxID=1559339 RepID=UPI00130464C7|nr:DUF3857 domain-containing protein [Chitinimonas sp. BJB300]
MIEKNNVYYRIEADGSYLASNEVQLLLREERALQQEGQQYIYLNKQLDQLVSLEAYTLKADGRKVPVTPEQIKTQADPVSSNAPMFNDGEYKVIVFPDLAVGDRAYFKYSRKRQPVFPGYFTSTTLPEFNPHKESTAIFDVPDSLALKVEAHGYVAVPALAAKGRKVYEWRYGLKPKDRIEAGSVAYIDYGDRLQVSTFKDYAELAKAYEQGVAEKAKPTPKLTALAKELTQGVSDARSKAMILSDWVRQNIRYVAIYLGRGGVVPHAAEDVLSNRYGDCKDHTTLLEALLAAVDIDSTTALINNNNSYRLPEVPVVGAFNHAITYIPSLDLYTDSTAAALGAGFLGPGERGKSVLLTKSGHLARTPALQKSEAQSQMQFVLQESGAAQLMGTQKLLGWGAELNRYVFRNMPETEQANMVKNLLLRSGLKGEGTLVLDADRTQRDQQGLTFKAQIESYAAFPGPVGMPTLSSLSGGVADAITSYLPEPVRTQPFPCSSGKATEEASYVLPNNVKVVSMPKPVKLEDRYFLYNASYKLEGQKVSVKRELEVKSIGQVVCMPADFEAMLPSLKTMLRDAKSQIIVEGI